jgi:CRP-like cAMP-binding protein
MSFDSSAFVSEPTLLQKLLEHALPLDCSKGPVLFRQGENPYGLFILRRGKAIMTLESERGAMLIRIQLAPGSILGLPALMSEKPYTMSAVAKRSAVVSYVTRKVNFRQACVDQRMKWRTLCCPILQFAQSAVRVGVGWADPQLYLTQHK